MTDTATDEVEDIDPPKAKKPKKAKSGRTTPKAPKPDPSSAYTLEYPMELTRREAALFETETGISHTIIPLHILDVNKPSAHIENVLTLIALQRKSSNYTMDNVMEGNWVLDLDPLIGPVKEKLAEHIARTKKINSGEVQPKDGDVIVPLGMMQVLEPEPETNG